MDYNNIIITISSALLAFIVFRKLSFAINKNIKNISVEEGYQLIKTNKDVIIIDVRTKEEFKSGHIPGSKSIPVAEFASRINELNKYKATPVLVHCASGGRSPAAVRVLLKHNFSNIYHMKRGLRGWEYGLK